MGKKVTDFVDRIVGTPFVWGRSDCAMVVLQYLDYVNDWLLFEKYSEQYTSLTGAIRFSKQMSVDKLLVELNFIEVQKNFEMVGDILLVQDAELTLSHINLGRFVLSSQPDIGVCLVEKMLINPEYKVLRCPLR